MPSKGLATSGTRWGLSCTVADEASMGVILGHMKLFGADDIGFEPLGPAVKRHKNPANVKAGKAGGRPTRYCQSFPQAVDRGIRQRS
jgi:hypothetical protein